MTQDHQARPSVPNSPSAEFEISVRTGSGQGRTRLSAFDSALLAAGVANYNLLPLSSVIPPSARVSRNPTPLPGGHGDRLLCVYAAAHADHPGEHVWAGLGWTIDSQGRGLFVEHTAGGSETVEEQILLSLADMAEERGGGYGRVEMALASAHCVSQPVCALAIAAYEVQGWGTA